MSEQPSEILDPTQLDQALLVVVVRRDGSSVVIVRSDVSPGMLADWLEATAAAVRDGRPPCHACEAGVVHTHDPEGYARGHGEDHEAGS